MDWQQLKKVQTVDEFTTEVLCQKLASFSVDVCSQKTKDFSIWIEYLKQECVRNKVETFCKDPTVVFGDSEDRRILILAAVCCLQIYAVDNFLCRFKIEDFPEVKQLVELVDSSLPPSNELKNVSNLIPKFSTVNMIRLLEFARSCFTAENLDSPGFSPEESLLWKTWSLRSIVAYQKSLQQNEAAFHKQMIAVIKDLSALLDTLSPSPNFKLNLYCEIVNSFLTFRDVENSKFYLDEAKKLSRFDFQLTGNLGVRTQYQQKELPQLTVTWSLKDEAEVNNNQQQEPEDAEESEKLKRFLPPVEKLEDDTLLPEIRLKNPVDLQSLNVSRVEQCLFLSTFKYRFLFGHSDDILLEEELIAMISFLLEKGDIWSGRYLLLNYRCLIERNSRRRVERSMKQMETLATIVRNFEGSRDAFLEQVNFRLENFYTVAPPPVWKVEKNLADILHSLGLIKSSLEIYKRLESWDQIIDCYRRIQQPDKAEAIVRERIEKGENLPYWFCLLGEVTDNIEFFMKSRELSNNQYARASKMLGLHYFSVKDYEKSLEFFEESVSVNYLQTDCWYRIGFLALEKEDWTLAAKAYRNVLQFDTDSFEAWNNLSKAYIKQGDKDRALKTLQEAIKCNYDEWKLWDNYIAVALDVRAFNDVFIAFNRLLDLNKNYVDDAILAGIAYIVFENVEDTEGRPASYHMSKVMELFARIAAIGDPTVSFWRHYAHILIFKNEPDVTKITQCLQKCHRKMITSKGWESDAERILNVCNHCSDLYTDYQSINSPDGKNVLNSCKLLLNSALTQIRKAHANLDESKVEPEIMSGIVEGMEKINGYIVAISNDQM